MDSFLSTISTDFIGEDSQNQDENNNLLINPRNDESWFERLDWTEDKKFEGFGKNKSVNQTVQATQQQQ